MPPIRILPEVLSNQIAAGEVVERPASVVKELVENALDAGATRIHVSVERGGRSLVQVSDNGSGMSRDDALMAIERYATSKLREPGDLFAIRTLGFRGEALPSIAAVSRLTLTTREPQADVGTALHIEGGTLRDVRDAGVPPGTQVSVRQLFFNTPARRKFLKSIATEMGHIADTLAGIALAHPQVGLRLDHDDRMLRQWPAVAEPVVRAADVLGRSLQNHLQAVAFASDSVQVSGWVAPPLETRTTSRGIYLFVNGRYVRDRGVQHGLTAGFGQRLMKGQYPVAVIFIQVPFDRVDVNVHPTKHEVRFAEARNVHDGVATAVSRALSQAERIRWPADSQTTPPRPEQTAETAAGFGPVTGVCREKPITVPIALGTGRPEGSVAHRAAITTYVGPSAEPGHPRTAEPPQQGIWRADRFTDLRLVGQLHGTYVLCQNDAGLVIIDQHAAHERIYYEQLRRAADAHRAPAQALLIPETVDLGFREAAALEPLIDRLCGCGLEIEPFGGNTFAVKTIPAFMTGRPVQPLLQEIAEQAAETGSGDGMDAALDRTLKLMACHGAVRGNQRLSETELKALFVQLDACDHPDHCPHGRPTWIQVNLRELEKRFGRIAG